MNIIHIRKIIAVSLIFTTILLPLDYCQGRSIDVQTLSPDLMTKPGTSEGWAESVFKKAIASELEREGWDLSKIEDDVRLFDGVCIVCFSQKRQEGSAAYVPCLLDKELFLGVIDLHTRDIIISQTPKEKAAVRSPGMFSRIRRKLLGAGLGLAMAVSLAGCPHGETPIAPVVVEDGVVSEADLEEDLVADETSAGPVFITDEQGNTVFTLPEGVFEHIFYPEQSYADRSGFAAFRFVETGTNLVEECYADADMSILLMRVEYDRAGNVKGYHWFTSEGDSLVEMIYDGYGTLTRQIFYDTGYNPSEIYNFGGFGRLESYEYNFTSSQSGFIFPKIIEVYESGRLTETREYGTNGLLAVVKKHNKYNSEKIEFYHFFDEYYENGQPVVERVYFSLNRSYLAREIFYDVSGEVTVKNTHNSLSGDRSFKYDYGQEGECVSIECTDGEGNILYRLGSTGIANILKVTEGDASIDVSYTYVWDNFDLQGLEEVTYVYLRGDKWVTLHDSHEGDLAYLRFTDEELRRIGFCLDQAPEEVFESLKYVVAAGYTPGRLGEASVGGIIELVGRKDPVTGEKIFEIPEEALIARTLKGLAVEGYELDITMNHEIGHHRHYVAEKNDQEQQAWSAFEDLHVKSGEDPYNYLDAYNLSPDENPYGESSSYEDFATIFSFFMSYTDQLFQEAVARASRGHTVLLEKVIMMSYFFLNDDGRSISAGKYDYVLDTIVSKSWPITLYRGSLVIGDFVFELDENNYILSATRSSGEVTEFGVTSSINCSHLLGTLTEPDNSFLLDEVFLDAAWQYQSKNTVPGGVKLLESADFGNEPWDPGSFSSGLMYPFPGNKPRQDTPVRHFPDIDKGLRDTAGNFRKGVRDILLGQGHIAEEDVVREVCVNVDIFPVITKDNESLVETILETVALKQERLDRLTGKEKIRFVLRSLSGDSEKEERIKNMYSKLRVSQEYEGRQEVIAGFAISDLSEEYDYGKYRLLALKSKLFDEDQGGFYNIPLLLDLSVILTLLAGKEDHDKFHNVINGILKASGNSPISEANLDILLGNDIRESLTLSRKIAIKPVSRFAFGDLVILHEYCLEFEKQA